MARPARRPVAAAPPLLARLHAPPRGSIAAADAGAARPYSVWAADAAVGRGQRPRFSSSSSVPGRLAWDCAQRAAAAHSHPRPLAREQDCCSRGARGGGRAAGRATPHRLGSSRSCGGHGCAFLAAPSATPCVDRRVVVSGGAALAVAPAPAAPPNRLAAVASADAPLVKLRRRCPCGTRDCACCDAHPEDCTVARNPPLGP